MFQIKEQFRSFMKDETGAAFTPDQIAKNGKKIIGTGLTLATIASFSPETIKSNDAIRQFTDKALLEYFFATNRTENYLIYSAQNKTKENSLVTLSLPLPKNLGNDLSSQENLQRALLYNLDATPSIAVNGNLGRNILSTPDGWLNKILNGIETQKNWAKFEMVPKGDSKYTLKVKGLDPQLNKLKNVYLNAVLVENVVNVNYYKAPTNDSTVRDLVRQYLFKDKKGNPSALGKLVVLNNGGTISEDIQLDIPKGLEEKFTVVAWIQKNPENDKLNTNKDNTEVLGAATCRIGTGKILDFNWNNWPKDMEDANEEIKKEYYMPLGLGEMTLNLKNAENLKTMNFDFNKHDFRDKYRVVGVKPNPELFDITFDQRYNRTSIIFKKPINGNLENAITYIVDFKNQDNFSTGFRFCWLDIRDKDGNFPYVNMGGEPVQYGPVRLFVSGFKPLDFNQDKRIDYDDVNEVVKAFGCIPTDPEWNQKYDIDKNNRIDILDLVTTIKAADREAAIRDQFHDNLKRLNIWEKKEISICKLNKALYGNEGKWIDVTETLKNKLDNGDFEMRITSDNLCKGQDPDYGATKILKITYDDEQQKDFEIGLEEWDTYKFKIDCITKKSVETNQWSNNFSNRTIKKQELQSI